MNALSTHFFFFNDTATTEIYTLSLHDALPICVNLEGARLTSFLLNVQEYEAAAAKLGRSEEHTSELQSPCNLVCRLLLEKKNEPYNRHARHRFQLQTSRRVNTSSVMDARCRDS